MNSTTQLALMSKAKKVFCKDDTFLSFPISPLSYTKRELDFFSQNDADDLQQSLQNLQEFSKLVNLIPSDEMWPPVEMRFLWDVYEQILKEGNLAFSTRTPDEEAHYQQALAYLHVTGEDGMREDRAPLKAYKLCRDPYEVAQQKYLGDKNTAECSTDLNEKQRWKDVNEPAQRAILDALETKWIVEGYKNEVETAQSIVVSLGARSPIQTWAEWKSHFNWDTDTLTGVSDTSIVFPSIFSPSNAVEEGSWVPFKLSEEEIKVLIDEVPEELRARFSAGSTASSVKSVTFEFSSATIQRSWIVPDVFRSRFWQFADATKVLSDGCIPPSGICPAYVTAIVFARKVSVEEKQANSGEIITKPSFEGFPAIVLHKKGIRRVSPSVLNMHPPNAEQNVLRALPRLRVKNAEVTLPKVANKQVEDLAMMRPTIVSNAVVKPVMAQEASSRLLLNLRARSVIRLPQSFSQSSIQVTKATPPTSSPQPSQPIVQDETIYILAFICKALPKCPDPDLTLQW